jgi:hypothetical protein
VVPRQYAAAAAPKRVAAVVTHYTHNSHADVIVSKLLQTYTLDGRGPRPNLQLVSLYVDQFPANDMSRQLAAEYGFTLCEKIADTLLLGGKDLAVDGVLLIGEHGSYPESDTGQVMFPRRRFFEDTAAVFRQVGRAVPVFSDKHLAWNWEDAKWMYDTARELKVPLMAGSSVPGTWRHPPLEMQLGAPAREAVGLSFGGLEAYGFHGLEAIQCLAERRRRGETGVAAVQYLEGDAVWKAGDAGRFDLSLFAAAANAREAKGRTRGEFRDALRPAAFFIEYLDRFRAVLLHDLGPANGEWIVAWSEDGRADHQATVFWTRKRALSDTLVSLFRVSKRCSERGCRPGQSNARCSPPASSPPHSNHANKAASGSKPRTWRSLTSRLPPGPSPSPLHPGGPSISSSTCACAGLLSMPGWLAISFAIGGGCSSDLSS